MNRARHRGAKLYQPGRGGATAGFTAAGGPVDTSTRARARGGPWRRLYQRELVLLATDGELAVGRDISTGELNLSATVSERAIGRFHDPSHAARKARVEPHVLLCSDRRDEVCELEPERLMRLDSWREDVTAPIRQVVLPESLRVAIDDAAVK